MDDGSSSNSSSSESSSSSGSSSASSSSGSESSSTEEKTPKTKVPTTITNNNNNSSSNNNNNNMNTRRKSLETKNIEKPNVIASSIATSNKRPTTTTNSIINTNPRVLRNNLASSDEDSPSMKKISKSNSTVPQKRKVTTTNHIASANLILKNQANQIQAHHLNSLNNEKPSICMNTKSSSTNNNLKTKNRSISKLTEDDSEKEQKVLIPTIAAVPITAATLTSAKLCSENKQNAIAAANKKALIKTPVKLSTINPAIAANKPKTSRKKQAVDTSMKKSPGLMKKENIKKSSDESDSDSDSDSDDDSSTTSESEATASSHSFSSHGGKTTKNKRTPLKNNNKVAQTDTDEDETTPRKLTRSFSNRVNKQLKKERSHTESTTEGEEEKTSKNPARKTILTNGISSKNKFKKETNGAKNQTCIAQPHIMSPPCIIEKKCPIEGCDSSGHLSGNLERHFLPDACPMYHNMSASECKERANERKIRNELRSKAVKVNTLNNISGSSTSTVPKILTSEQKDFLAKVQESRANFKPITNANDKVKLEKDYTEEDREPNLNGFVPDYDLQLFREAQAIASQKIESEVKELPVGKGIKYITMGKYKMKVWYQSPYPDDAARLPQMYICEFCLRYQKSETSIKRHAQKCVWRHPPGDEIYRKGKLQVWQVDGKRQKQYCQHLCLLAKFFLDHKTLYYDVEPFLFYIMTLADVDGCHTVGYFSKEKNSFYNVSCILTLPPYQRKGYGRLLIDFSYLLTRVEGKIGSPEKPLSDLGLISYRSYWKDVLLDYLCNRSGSTLSIKDVSQEMAIYSYDIVSTLQALGMMKYWKGKHIVLKKQDVLDEYAERVKRRGTFPKIDETCLRWSPFVPTQNSDTL